MTTEFSAELSSFATPHVAPVRTVNPKRLLRERWPLMVAVALALAIPSCIVSWLLLSAEYEAGATLRFLRNKQSVLFNANNSYVQSTDYEQHVLTEAGLIVGPVIDRVLNDPDIRDHPYIAKRVDPLLFLQESVQAQMRPNQELVDITFRAPDRDLSVAVVTKTVENYLELAATTNSKRGGERRNKLAEERDRVETQLEALRARIAQKRESLGTARVNVADGSASELEQARVELAAAESKRTSAELDAKREQEDVERLETLLAAFESDSDAQVFEFGIEERVESDALVVSTAELVAIEENALAIAEETYQSDAPQLKVQRDRRDSVYAKLNSAKQSARRTAIGTALERARAEAALAQRLSDDAGELEQGRRDQVEQLEARSLTMMQAQNQLDEWEREADAMQQFLTTTVSAITQIDVESNAPASVEVAAQPYAPARPSQRRRIQTAVALIALSMGAGVCAGFLREMTDQQIRSPQDLSHITQAPLLAVLPHTRYDQLPSDVQPSMIMSTHPASTTADEYRRILGRIVYPAEGSAELNSCLITGASRGDGKTTVACNLAIALAQANRKVLILDICARRPNVERNFGFDPAAGLAEIFEGDSTLDAAIRSTAIQGLDLLGPGTAKGFVVGRYASRELVQLLEQAEQTYDHVIIDSPPALLMADASMLAPVVDAVMVVTGAGISSQGMVRRCIQDLTRAGANVAGIVLNRAKPVPGGYMAANLQSYYHYGQEQPEPASAHSNKHSAESGATMLLLDDTENESDSTGSTRV